MEVQKSRVNPYNGLYGKALLGRVHFSGFRYMEGLGISLLDQVHKKVGKYVISVDKKAQKG